MGASLFMLRSTLEGGEYKMILKKEKNTISYVFINWNRM